MGSSTEVESKFALDADDFHRLRQSVTVHDCVRQLNVYFDQSWRLAMLSATCRVRFTEGSSPVLTVKLPISSEAGRRVMSEFEYELPKEAYSEASLQHSEIDVDRELPPEIGERLLGLGLNRLQCLGGMRNCRYLLFVDDLGRIDLDEVMLPDGSSYYEAEIEDSDLERHRRLAEWLRTVVPNARPSNISKFQRFREALTAHHLAELASSLRSDSSASKGTSNTIPLDEASSSRERTNGQLRC